MKITRRALLSSAASVVVSGPTIAQNIQNSGSGPLFWGNPNVTITAIDTSGGIVVPRGGGQTPFFVHVSASAIKATGATRPYEDLEFTWDFGDPTGTEIFNRPPDETKVNANIQIGPEAAYCYRKPGTYTITLTVRGCGGLDANGKPSRFISATITRHIQALAFNAAGGNWYFDSVGGNDQNDGRSPAKPKQSLAAIAAAAAIPNVSIHLKRGSTWFLRGPAYAALVIKASPLRIDAYGLGAKPTIITNAHAAIYLPNNKAFNDIVMSNLALVIEPSSDKEQVGYNSGQGPFFCTYIYLDNVDITNRSGNGSLYSAFAGNAAKELGVKAWIGGGTWNCAGRNPSQIHSAFNFGATQWMFHYGLTINGDTNRHHINPENTDGHAVYRWVKTVGGIESTFFSFCLACRVREYAGADHSYQLVSECYFEGGMDGISCNAPNTGPESFVAHAFIIERCAFNGLQRTGFGPAVLGEGTLRDNKFWNCDGGIHVNIGSGIAGYATVNYYRNKHYRTGTSSRPVLLIHPSTTGSLRWQITDNEIYDARPRSNANIIALNFSDQLRAGSLIDRNQYFAPNAGGAFLNDNGARKSFAEWQSAGFDRNGRIAKPDWPDPENGQF